MELWSNNELKVDDTTAVLDYGLDFIDTREV